MSDRPWLDSADPALRSERALLKRLNGQEPPPGSVEQGWAALAAQIAVPPPVLDPSPVLAPAAKSAGVSLAAKVVAGVALTGGLAFMGAQLLAPAAPPAEISRQVTPPLAPAPRLEASAEAQAPVVVEPPAVKAQLPASPRPSSSATTLAEEGRLLAKAHQLVQSGRGQQALQVLRDLESRYPRSVLYQEREVLTIEALGSTGASSAAKQRAQRFLKRYPGSPHAGRLERFL